MGEYQKALINRQFRVMVINVLKKEFPEDFYRIENDLETWIITQTLPEVRQTAKRVIFMKRSAERDRFSNHTS
jgi:hypothetical protein